MTTKNRSARSASANFDPEAAAAPRVSARERALERATAVAEAIADFKGIERPEQTADRTPAYSSIKGKAYKAIDLRAGDVIRDPHRKGSKARVSGVDRSGLLDGGSQVSIHFRKLLRDELSKTDEVAFIDRDALVHVFREGDRINDPSAPSSTVHNDSEQPTGRSTTEGEATVATITRSNAKKPAAKPAAKKPAAKTAAKPAATARTPKFNPDVAAVRAMAKRLREKSATMSDLKTENGLSNGQPIRNALYAAGFDSKGNENPEGKTARQLSAERASTAPAKPAAKRAAKTATTDEPATPKASGKRTAKRAVKANPSNKG